jgi:hypothetical protein
MNTELLAAFLNDHNGFDGGAIELYTALKSRKELRALPDLPFCGEDFLAELRTKIPELEAHGVSVVCLPNGGVRIKTGIAARQDQDSESALHAEYNGNPQLRREFATFASYAAYQRAVASGRFRSIAPTQGPKVGSETLNNEDNRGPQSTVDPRLPLEERCRQRWALEPATRAEFNNHYEAFEAYERASTRGQVRRFRSTLAG